MSKNRQASDMRVFGICGNGSFTDPTPTKRDVCCCCGGKFNTWNVQVELFEFDIVCPDCILSGPKQMAKNIREKMIPIEIDRVEKEEKTENSGWTIPYLSQFAKILEKKESITDFPNGIFAVKIAEAYREIQEGRAA